MGSKRKTHIEHGNSGMGNKSLDSQKRTFVAGDQRGSCSCRSSDTGSVEINRSWPLLPPARPSWARLEASIFFSEADAASVPATIVSAAAAAVQVLPVVRAIAKAIAARRAAAISPPAYRCQPAQAVSETEQGESCRRVSCQEAL